MTDGGGVDGSGGCAQVPARKVAVYTGGTGSIREGVSTRQVTSVTAQLPGGRSVAGVAVAVSVLGLDGKVWLVDYPVADTAQIVFRNASGHELGHLTVAGHPPFPVAAEQRRDHGVPLPSRRGRL
jgi:hypothetical protein